MSSTIYDEIQRHLFATFGANVCVNMPTGTFSPRNMTENPAGGDAVRSSQIKSSQSCFFHFILGSFKFQQRNHPTSTSGALFMAARLRRTVRKRKLFLSKESLGCVIDVGLGGKSNSLWLDIQVGFWRGLYLILCGIDPTVVQLIKQPFPNWVSWASERLFNLIKFLLSLINFQVSLSLRLKPADVEFVGGIHVQMKASMIFTHRMIGRKKEKHLHLNLFGCFALLFTHSLTLLLGWCPHPFEEDNRFNFYCPNFTSYASVSRNQKNLSHSRVFEFTVFLSELSSRFSLHHCANFWLLLLSLHEFTGGG